MKLHNQASPTTLWPWLAILLLLAASAYQLMSQGRLWICECGRVQLWAGDIFSSDNSQHLADPYTFTHVLHGFVFLWLLVWIAPRMTFAWQLFFALLIESAWEVLENTEMIIDRYRESTAALGYHGDTIVNSIADIIFCGLGFVLAHYLGFRRSLVLFILVEIFLLIWIKDSLILNVIMLIYPLDGLRAWQLG